MKYQIVYESQSGNTAKVARAMANALPAEETQLTDLKVQTPSRDGEIYCVGFGVRNSTCSMKLLEFLELLHGKTVLLFATCGLNPSEGYHDMLERSIVPFLPDDCDYRGFYLCQGSISDEGCAAIKHRLAQAGNEEALQRFDTFRAATFDHPSESDLEEAVEFMEQALDLW